MSQNKVDIMVSLCITDNDLVNDRSLVIEKLFCAAILKQGTDVANKVLNDFIRFRDCLYQKP